MCLLMYPHNLLPVKILEDHLDAGSIIYSLDYRLHYNLYNLKASDSLLDKFTKQININVPFIMIYG